MKYPELPRIAIGYGNWFSHEEFKAVEERCTSKIINRVVELAKQVVGDVGMDFLMNWRTIDCLRNGLPLEQDVYDAALWSSIAPLSEWSAANQSNSIPVPDFTCGAYKNNVPVDITLAQGGNTKIKAIAK